LHGVEQQREREERLRADYVMFLELLDLVIGPGVESVALDRAQLDVCRRVRAQPSALERKLTERAQRREPRAGGVRRLGVKQRLDPFRWQERERPITIRGAKPFKDSAPDALRARTFRGEELL
jgi:hypothetical protein